MIYVSPSLLASDLTCLKTEIQRCDQAGVDSYHLDIMDGRFVPNISFGVPIVEAVRKLTKKVLHSHLMIVEPENYVEVFRKVGSDWISFHVEAATDSLNLLKKIRSHGARAGVSLNPATPISTLEPLLEELDFVLVMSVVPGFGGQGFLSETLNKISSIRTRWPHLFIEVDGGIKLDNAKSIIQAGASGLVLGTGFFSTQDYSVTTKKLKSI